MPVAESQTVSIDAAHPALPGHFPGLPVVPGVVLLTEIKRQLQQRAPQHQVSGIKKLKFLRMLMPQQQFSVEFVSLEASNARFKCWQAGGLIAEGNLTLSAEGNLSVCTAESAT